MGKRGIMLLVLAALCLAPIIAITGPVEAQELSWEQLGENGLGGQGTRAFGMVVFDGDMYVGTLNQGGGGKVWRCDGGTDWTQVNANGFGNGDTVALSMTVSGGELYVGTRNDATGCQVLRYDGGSDWTQVNESGFGNANNKAAWGITDYNDALYIGTMNMANGGQVWCYDGGSNWTQVNANGFGDPSNRMVTSMVDLNGQLCAGTDNKTQGCQVWGAIGAPSNEDAVATPLPVTTETDSEGSGTSACTWLLYGLISLATVTLLLALVYYLVSRSRAGE